MPRDRDAYDYPPGYVPRGAQYEIESYAPRPAAGARPTDWEELRELPRVVAVPEEPLEEESTPKLLGGQGGAREVTVAFRRVAYAKHLTAVVRVANPSEISFATVDGTQFGNPTDATNPFNSLTAAGGLALPGNLMQSLEVVARCLVGHQDLQVELPFNMPLGQVVRVAQVGSVIRVGATLSPRYFPKLTVGGVSAWLVDATGSNFVRNAIFDGIVPLDKFAVPPTSPVQTQGFCGEGFSAPVPPQRVFFGWVDAGVAQNTQHLCPVPRGAQTVLLMADASTVNNDPAAGGAFQGFGLLFSQICQSPGGGTTRRVLNFPPNVTVPLRADCVAIEVVNVAAAPAVAIPFELQYDVGF